MELGENGIRIFFTVADVCENDTGNAFDWSIPCVWEWSSSTLHRQPIISQQLSLASFKKKFHFTLFPCFRCQNYASLWTN